MYFITLNTEQQEHIYFVCVPVRATLPAAHLTIFGCRLGRASADPDRTSVDDLEVPRLVVRIYAWSCDGGRQRRSWRLPAVFLALMAAVLLHEAKSAKHGAGIFGRECSGVNLAPPAPLKGALPGQGRDMTAQAGF